MRKANIQELRGQGFKREAIIQALGISLNQYYSAQRLQRRPDRTPEQVAIAELRAEGASEEVIRANFGGLP